MTRLIPIIALLLILNVSRAFALTAAEICGWTSTDADSIRVTQLASTAADWCAAYPDGNWHDVDLNNVYDSSQWTIQCQRESVENSTRVVAYPTPASTYNCYFPDPNDTDGDGWPDGEDECPDDPAKHEQGACGCGVPDVDTDGDGLLDCVDPSPEKDNKHGKGIVATDVTCDGQTVYYEIAYQDGTIERYGSSVQYNLIRNGLSDCTEANIVNNTIPKNSWEWDYNSNTMDAEQVIDKILDKNLAQTTGKEETEQKTGETQQGQYGTESNDSANLKTIADNTKTVTENQEIIAKKTDVTNKHLSDISTKMDEVINKPSDGVTKDQMMEVLSTAFADYVGTSSSTNTSELDNMVTQGENALTSAMDTLNNPITSDMIPDEYKTKTDIASEINSTLEDEQNQAKGIADVIAQTNVTYTDADCELLFPYHEKTIKLTMCNFAPQLQSWGNIIKAICFLHCLMIVFRRT